MNSWLEALKVREGEGKVILFFCCFIFRERDVGLVREVVEEEVGVGVELRDHRESV